MAWTAPRTWVTSELVTAAIGNAHWRDNFLATGVATVTTAGDLVYATAANTFARRAIGAAGTMLQPISGVPNYSNIGYPTITRKTATQTYTSDSTYNDDTHLTMAVAANEIWAVNYYLAVTTSATPGLKVTLTTPTTPTSFMATGIMADAASAASKTPGQITTGGSDIINTNNAIVYVHIFALLANGANAGSLTLQHAQATSNVATTGLLINSFMVAIRVA